MNLALAYDTETTGLPLFKERADHPQQPHLVQLAAVLIDLDTRKHLQSMDVIIKPNGWVIPDRIAEIHGITTEHALAVGVPESVAVSMFLSLWGGRSLIAHNEQFDRLVMDIAIRRHVLSTGIPSWNSASAECTAKLSTNIVQLPPTEKMLAAGRNHPKTPQLGEAFQFFTEMELKNAHSAMADVMACLEVYWAIKNWDRELDTSAV